MVVFGLGLGGGFFVLFFMFLLIFEDVVMDIPAVNKEVAGVIIIENFKLQIDQFNPSFRLQRRPIPYNGRLILHTKLP